MGSRVKRQLAFEEGAEDDLDRLARRRALGGDDHDGGMEIDAVAAAADAARHIPTEDYYEGGTYARSKKKKKMVKGMAGQIARGIAQGAALQAKAARALERHEAAFGVRGGATSIGNFGATLKTADNNQWINRQRTGFKGTGGFVQDAIQGIGNMIIPGAGTLAAGAASALGIGMFFVYVYFKSYLNKCYRQVQFWWTWPIWTSSACC